MKVFDFGENWQEFSERQVDAGRLESAGRSLQALLGRECLDGMSFLDVGCGSGLFAIAATRLGAARVTGIDVNPRCISVSKRNREKLAPRVGITFQSGNVLQSAELAPLGRFDVVYAWGSLHHSGAMWDAVRNTTKLVEPQGTLVLALYNKHFTSPVWERIKWFYNWLPRWGQHAMLVPFAAVIYVAKLLVTYRNPLEKTRGMDFWYDVIDWVGGWPYEYASPDEVKRFVSPLGFTLRKVVPAQVPTGCNEFVFTRTG